MDFEKIQYNNFEIKKENIIALDCLPDKVSEKMRSLGWPLEYQGSGRTLEDGKNLQVRYPHGDVFYAWNVIIHELGHLRQEDFNAHINACEDGAKENIEREKDAFARGMERLKKYRPDVLDKLEADFSAFKQVGKIPEFQTFLELYNDFNENNIKIYKTLEPEDSQDIIYEKLKSINISDFFKKIETNKVGVKIDIKEVNEVIFDIASQIVKE